MTSLNHRAVQALELAQDILGQVLRKEALLDQRMKRLELWQTTMDMTLKSMSKDN